MRALWTVTLLVIGALSAWAGDKMATDADALAAEIAKMRPEKQVWSEIPWRTCPLAAFAEARKTGKPVIAWVFLGNPSDERC